MFYYIKNRFDINQYSHSTLILICKATIANRSKQALITFFFVIYNFHILMKKYNNYFSTSQYCNVLCYINLILYINLVIIILHAPLFIHIFVKTRIYIKHEYLNK